MVSGSLAMLYFLLGFYGGRQDSGPDRGRGPVEWGDFRMDGRTDGRTDGWTDRRTNRKSPHSTGLCPQLGPLPKKDANGFFSHFYL